MPLLLLDLDDTLVDRTAAFRAGVVELLARFRLPVADLTWVMDVDAGGHAPRDAVASAIAARYGLALSVEELSALLRAGVVAHVRLADETRRALELATERGWTPVVVTNGPIAQQQAKLGAVGLDELVAGWVTAEAAGVAKPDPEIFLAAGRLAGMSLDGAWMVGDHPEMDVSGAAALGLATVWLSHGRSWPSAVPAPTFVAESAAEAIGYVVAARPSP